jgi:hypothetical protein
MSYTGSTPKFDSVEGDNIKVDGNTISSTNENGDINLAPNGTGKVTVPTPSQGDNSTSAASTAYVDAAADQTLLDANTYTDDQIAAIPPGEVATVANVGTGAGVYKEKVGYEFKLKSLVAGSNVTITENADDLTISSSGATSEEAYFITVIDVFSGDGLETDFTLSESIDSVNKLDIHIGGVYQQKSSYTVTGTTLSFSEAPPAGTDNIEVIVHKVLVGSLGGGTTGQALIKNSSDEGDFAWASFPTDPMEIFNVTITKASNDTSLTGLLHFKAPKDLTISSFKAQIFEKGATASGTLSVDVKKNSSPDDAGMTSVFSALPSFDFSLISDYAESGGTLSATSVSEGNYLRLDLPSIPASFVGTIQILMYA